MPTDAKVFIGNRSSKNMSQFVDRTCDGDPKANPPCFYLYVGLKMGLNPVCPAVLTQYQHQYVNSDFSINLWVETSQWRLFFLRSPTGRKISTDVQVSWTTNTTKIDCPFPQVGGFLDVYGAPRRRSWRPEEERRVSSLGEEEAETSGKEVKEEEEETNGRLYVNLPERSASYDFGRGGASQSRKMEVRVSSFPETTTPLWQNPNHVICTSARQNEAHLSMNVLTRSCCESCHF